MDEKIGTIKDGKWILEITIDKEGAEIMVEDSSMMEAVLLKLHDAIDNEIPEYINQILDEES